jgi:hypothetical protein
MELVGNDLCTRDMCDTIYGVVQRSISVVVVDGLEQQPMDRTRAHLLGFVTAEAHEPKRATPPTAPIPTR